MRDHRSSRPAVRRVLAALAAVLVAVTLLAAPAAPAAASPAPAHHAGTSPNAGAAVAAIIRGNEQKAFGFFVGKGLSPTQAAGVVGNLDQESGMDPRIKQIGGGPGRGIAQWSVGGRWDTYRGDNLVAYAKGRGAGKLVLGTQLDFVWFELTTFSYYGLRPLRAATTIAAAATAFQNDFEGCGDCNTAARVAFANAAYRRYA